MAINKVNYGGQTLIDTSEDTAEAGDVLSGKTFHSKNGTKDEGTLELPVKDVEVDGTSVVSGGVASIDLTGKQDTLVSGTNIKTVNNNSLLGSGNVDVGVTGVKGNDESTYRTGNVNLTPANIGALPISGGTLSGGTQIFNCRIANSSSRETTASPAVTGKRGITSLMSSGTMTTGRPPSADGTGTGEGTIIHCEWDNTGGWNSQLFIADNDSGNGKPFVAVRGQRSGTWTSWDRLLLLSDAPNFIAAHQYDCDWTDLPLRSTASIYSSDQKPMYKRYGDVVQVYGAVKPKAQVAAGGSLDFATLPDHYRPPRSSLMILCQGSANNKWVLYIGYDGLMSAQRYSTGGTAAAMPTSVWLPFSVTFLV